MTFAEAKKQMLELNTEESSLAFMQALAEAVNLDQTMLIPTHKAPSGQAIELHQQYGEMYAVCFTSRDYAVIRPEGMLMETGMGKIVDLVYSNPRLAGIVLDPQGAPVYIRRRQIDACSDKKDPRLLPRDWGEGIPVYDQSDRIVIEELMDFAMDIVQQYAVERYGYSIAESHSSPVFLPNLILEKDGQLYYAAVEAAIAPELPRLHPKKLEALKGFAASMDAKCLYAPVGIGSTDTQRFSERLALCGDSFMVNFNGFQEV
ncbi:MAG: hypothetical protein MJ135_04195 [Oscillospiraceae bacterium]|nr:hypothetical protein [Oscillospiraceae bacterium]